MDNKQVPGDVQEEAQQKTHELEITYKIDGEVIKVIKREIDEKYRWFLLGNMSWREW